MKTIEEWARGYFMGEHGDILAMIRKVRAEALEEASKVVHLYDGSSGAILIRLEEAIRQLKEQP